MADQSAILKSLHLLRTKMARQQEAVNNTLALIQALERLIDPKANR